MRAQWRLVVACLCCLWIVALSDFAQGGKGKPEYKSGLAGHYYRDADYWGGVWPDTVAVPPVSAADHTFSEYRYTRVEPLINHQFIRSGWFTVRWQGALDTAPAGEADKTATYTFYIWADDGCRLTIDGQALIADWRPCSEDSESAVRCATVVLAPGKHTIVVEYFEGQSLKKDDKDPMKLYWECPDRHIPKQIIPAAHFSHTDDDLTPLAGRLDAK